MEVLGWDYPRSIRPSQHGELELFLRHHIVNRHHRAWLVASVTLAAEPAAIRQSAYGLYRNGRGVEIPSVTHGHRRTDMNQLTSYEGGS